MPHDKLTARAREPAPKGGADTRRVDTRDVETRTGVASARDEAARALDRLDTARRKTARARGSTSTVVPLVREQRLADAAHALAEAARELTLVVLDCAPEPVPGELAPTRARRPADGEPLVTLDLAHRVAPGWRLCQFTTADRDAHRWQLRHEGHAGGTVTHVLGLRGRRAGWEAYDARGFRLRPGPGPEAYRPGAPHLWATRTAAVRAVAGAHRCP
ncbi:hypothetical protein E1293_19010 [Actinomadura darangshiensis]|uniref:Uncharacterized protein n=1 Tax=Actinomadura darangshiensis TaxID=705336 RepID=A0A4R5BBW6_9ACTN|nr:hypothetical protein [Actinomadura darangshiensis]TDD81254.1 hypothetical protein E1293_19010 [Actinomadura darangshiensis]